MSKIGVLGVLAGWCLFASAPSHGAEPSSGDKPLQSGEPLPLAKAREVGLAKSAVLAGPKSREVVVPSTGIPPTGIPPTGPPKPNLADFKKHVAPVFTKNCVACHGPNKAEGKLRVDQLNPDLLKGPDVNKWLEIFGALSNGEMPPEDEPKYQLADGPRANIIQWLGQEIQKASKARRDEGGHSSFRRMTKYEYNYALRDLLGLPYEFAGNLPPETISEDGFKNSSDLLRMSAMQFQTYREVGLKALQQAAAIGEPPPLVVYQLSMRQEMDAALKNKKAKTFDRKDKNYDGNARKSHLFDRESGKGIHLSSVKWSPKPDAVVAEIPPVSPVVAVFPQSSELKLNLDRFLPDEGIMRVRIRAGRSTVKPDEHVGLRLVFSAHTSNNANFTQVISKRDVPVTASADNPQFIDFHIPLSEIPRNPFRKLTTTFPRRDEFLHIKTIANTNGGKEPLQVLVDCIQIFAPFHEQWPPKSHTDIFMESEHKSDETKYAREVLTRFMERVWRRPVVAREVDPFMALFAEYRPELPSLEDAVLEVLATVLATPNFLYLMEESPAGAKGPTEISDAEWANRISFFLWSSIPDEELLQLARQGKLKDPKVLAAQVKRMLADPRARRFSQHFVQQWLGLDGLDSVIHVEDDSLISAMRQEPIAFFTEVLNGNGSVIDFIHSDYAVVNERLAAHYKIPGVYGPHFRKTPINDQMNRGGILTGAGVLAMNSDGKDSHPLKRGVWLLEHVLHDPPP
ncbi:MAG: DUF1592 domain-containing protein, partial [Planctomycetales bacterium]